MAVRKPKSISQDPWKNQKWNELVRGRSFAARDVPALTLLVQWYAVMQRAIDDIDEMGGQIVFQNKIGDLKSLPQIAVMKQASGEIRQLSKQLGIADEAGTSSAPELKGVKVIELAKKRREKRIAGAAGYNLAFRGGRY